MLTVKAVRVPSVSFASAGAGSVVVGHKPARTAPSQARQVLRPGQRPKAEDVSEIRARAERST